MKLVTAAQMRAIDQETIQKVGIPGPELMENAGRGIAEQILTDHIVDAEDTNVVVVCGKGNNGGDGYVVARYLHEAGVSVTILYVGPREKLSDDAGANYDRAKKLGIPMSEVADPDELPDELDCDIVIDAIFGTGFDGAPRGITEDLIEYINRQETEVIAVDMPSGLNADTGRHEGAVVEASFTYTLALPKYGLYLSPGRELSGVCDTVPIGIPDEVVEKMELTDELITPEMVIEFLPARKPDGHKGDFGKLVLVAGSTGLTGAACMAGQSAARSGAGLIKIACPHSVLPTIAAKMTEVMSYPLPDVAKKGALAVRALGELRKLIDEHDAVVLGPGIGRHRETFELVRRLLSKLDKPTIIDADGLNALAGHLDIIRDCSAPLVLTPHPGEFKRLVETSVPEDIREASQMVRDVADDLGVVLVLKGSPTLIAEPGGLCYINQTGNDGMATGGSGDVLSGIIGAFLGQGMTAIEAAVAGVFIHGMTGDLAAEAYTNRGMIPTDMISFLPKALALLEG
ncbi:NAD(P)H-hydrate dehydratase [candidate division GN15 bacterium]|nr:NAD(P)H-hydrate dehydratase [candidate division GN15 bacterium]